METAFKRAFGRDLKRLPQDVRGRIERFVFEEVVEAESTQDIGPIVKLSGHANYYRKRFGDYRVGFEWSGGMVIFYRVLHRKDIYRSFP